MASGPPPVTGLSRGDRALYLGIGQRRGKQGDIVAAFGRFATIRYDDGEAALARAVDLHIVPRRPPPDF